MSAAGLLCSAQLAPTLCGRQPVSAAVSRSCGICSTSGRTGQTSMPVTDDTHRSSQPSTAPRSLTQEILAQPSLEGDPAKFLRVSEAYWKAMKSVVKPKGGPDVIKRRQRPLPGVLDYDVVVCGGTLGLLLALALQLQGWRVCIVEKRLAEGRLQEWNSTRKELQVLVQLGLVTAAELEEAIVTEFSPARIEFLGGFSTLLRGVLDLGVLPKTLLQQMRRRFLDKGGTIRERCAFLSADVHDEGLNIRVSGPGAELPIEVGDANRPEPAPRTEPAPFNGEQHAASNGAAARHGSSSNGSSARPSNGASSSSVSTRTEIRARLLLDCMGHWSPIVKQMRGRQQPDGICLVVGGCAGGVPSDLNQTGDFLRTVTHAEDDMQLYWQSFPAAGGRDRTTYAFTYADIDRRRPSLEALLDRYFELLPRLCGCRAQDLQWRRLLFAGQPCYKNAPVQPHFDRILQVGDASASHSPLSFGGFGSMLRHLPRLSQGLHTALQQGQLTRSTLAGLQPYQPSLSSSWLFQRSMSFRVGQVKAPSGPRGRIAEGAWLPADHINRLLSTNFSVMQALGQWVMQPFVQDTMQWGPLSLTMAGMLLRSPLVIMRVAAQTGSLVLLDWFRHYAALTAYALLTRLAALVAWVPLLQRSFRWQRWRAAWAYGAGLEHTLHQAGTWPVGGPVRAAAA